MPLAILRLPDLAMIAQLMHIDNQDRVVLRGGCDVAGGALRLAPRALETHGRDVGYEIATAASRVTGAAGARPARAGFPGWAL
jgi:hypothetical protein